MSEAETKQATGSCAEISERGEWTTFHIDVGSQYPVKVSTKLQPIIELGRAAQKAGGRMVWTYNESDGNPNPNRPGTFYKNRYLQSVEPVDENAPDASAGSTAPQAQGRYSEEEIKTFENKERRDYRSRAWAQTLGAFTHTINVDEDPKDVFTRLQAFQRLVFVDVCQSFAYPEDESDLPF